MFQQDEFLIRELTDVGLAEKSEKKMLRMEKCSQLVSKQIGFVSHGLFIKNSKLKSKLFLNRILQKVSTIFDLMLKK